MTSIDAVLSHYAQVDDVIFKQLVPMELQLLTPLSNSSQYFQHLCRQIIGQQLAGKAADAIYKRFETLFTEAITPSAVLGVSEIELRKIGMSWAKVRYVLDLAQQVQLGQIQLDTLSQLNDEKVIGELIKVKGIGTWTAEMFLIFTLGREDVFSFGDLGLKNAFKKLYQVNEDDLVKKMIEVTTRWSPYRSYGSLALWHSLDLK